MGAPNGTKLTGGRKPSECSALLGKEIDMSNAPSIEAAYKMGAIGGPVVEAERLAFEAWMRGHHWALCATWNGSAYLSDSEHDGWSDPQAVRTRQLWGAWRDRAALTPNVEIRGGEAVPLD